MISTAYANADGAPAATAVGTFDRLMALDETSPGQFVGRCHEGTPGRAFGGHVAALALRAAGQVMEDGLVPHSMHALFLRPGVFEEPVTFDVERLRDGRTYAARRVTARQYGSAILTLSASFKRPEGDHGIRQPAMPAASPPDQLDDPYRAWASRDPADFARAVFNTVVDLRFVADAIGDPSGVLQQGIWIRTSSDLGEDPLANACALTYGADLHLTSTAALGVEPARALRTAPRTTFAASLDYSLWFHRPLRADDWLLLTQRSPTRGDGRAMTLADVWSADGRLVATVAQESVLKPLRRS